MANEVEKTAINEVLRTVTLINKRFEALKNTGRIEFDEGILKKLIEAFCDSPYIMQNNYEETLEEL